MIFCPEPAKYIKILKVFMICKFRKKAEMFIEKNKTKQTNLNLNNFNLDVWFEFFFLNFRTRQFCILKITCYFEISQICFPGVLEVSFEGKYDLPFCNNIKVLLTIFFSHNFDKRDLCW